MKNLVFVLPDKDAGVASVVRNLLQFKSSSNFTTTVVLLHNTMEDASNRIKDDFYADKIVRIKYNGKWSTRHKIFNKLKNELGKNSILISNDGGLDLRFINYFELAIPVVYIMHGDIKHYYNVVRENERIIGTLITVSNYLKERIFLLQNAQTTRFKLKIASIKFPVPNVENNKRNYNSDIINLVFVGSLLKTKGVYYLKEITELIDKKEIKYNLKIIGNGPEESNLKRLFKENSRVQMLGKRSNKEVLEMHQEHDILLLPSEGEGLPVVIVEAMKSGVIPMATNLQSGIPELIEHGKTGFTVGLNEIFKYANYIDDLYKNRNKMKSMSQLCIQKSEIMFDPIIQTRAYEECFLLAPKIRGKSSAFEKLCDFLPMTVEHRIRK